MLSIFILNVQHGDSIVIKYEGNNGPVFAVIDSNLYKREIPALQFLKNNRVEELSFIALTHPHADHYKGLPEIIYTFKDRIRNFYSFPLNRHIQGRLSKFTEIYRKVFESTDSSRIKADFAEFIKTLFYVKQYIGEDKWEEHTGDFNKIHPYGFDGVDIWIILPPAKNKGPYFQMIEQGSYDILSKEQINKLSLAFMIKYQGYTIILGGDAPASCWMDHKRFCDRASMLLNGHIGKLPHHGSKYDCTEKVIDHFYGNHGDKKMAFISASGISHPDPETYDLLKRKNIFPYCTNISKKCGHNLQELFRDISLSPLLERFILSMKVEHEEEIIQACQGNIEITIANDEINVSSEYDHLCPMRGDYDFILDNSTDTL